MDVKNSIITTLGIEGKDRFYVYALCDKRNHRPFYIGKGQSDRMWQHEEGFEAELKSIDCLRIPDKDKEELKEAVSEKHKKISELGNNVEKIIIKWGLEENEAFMAESALINLLNYSEKTLTNIVNGHASQREKEKTNNTSAMNDFEFFNNCCKPPVIFEEISDKCLFISINELYPQCLEQPIEMRDSAIEEATRGCWVIGKNRSTPKYLFGVYQSRICGVYRITDKKSNFDLTEFPVFPNNIRSKEKECISKINDDGNPSNYDLLSKSTKKSFEEYSKEFNTTVRSKIKKGVTVDYKKEYDNWQKRYYFICKKCTDEKIINMLGRIIKKKDDKSIFGSGNPLRYNY